MNADVAEEYEAGRYSGRYLPDQRAVIKLTLGGQLALLDETDLLDVEVADVLREVVDEGDSVISVEAGFLYERKGYASADPLGGTRNTSYGDKRDPIVLNVRIVVPYEAPSHSTLRGIGLRKAQAVQAALIAEAREEAKAALAAAEAAQIKLATLEAGFSTQAGREAE